MTEKFVSPGKSRTAAFTRTTFSTPSALPANDVRAAQVDIADFRREKDMDRLAERHADPVGRDMLAGGQGSDPALRLALLCPAGHSRQRSHD